MLTLVCEFSNYYVLLFMKEEARCEKEGKWLNDDTSSIAPNSPSFCICFLFSFFSIILSFLCL